MTNISDATLDAVARMYVAHGSVAMIAAATGLSRGRVQAIIASKEGADRVEACQGLVMKAVATHHFELLGMLDEVRFNIRGGLSDPDTKIRLETSKWLHDRITPRPTQRTDAEARHSLSPELTDAVVKIADSMNQLLGANPSTRALPVRMGIEALPRPTVIDVEDSGA